MVTYVIFEHLSHETIDTAADVRKKHENIRAVVLRGERAFDGIDLSANAFDTSDEIGGLRLCA